ncbi:MAG: hypothetical protein K6E33_06310 [Lachnospiraceae bacterium]|nr:hypothetical protein [Lachnospiraceae bacterium]
MRGGVIALIIFGTIAGISAGTAGYRFYTINHIDDRLEKLYAKEDAINESMSSVSEKYDEAMNEISNPYDAASEELDNAWSRYNEIESYNSGLIDLINTYGEDEEETEETEEETEETVETTEESTSPAAPSETPAPAPNNTDPNATNPPTSTNPVPEGLDLLECETYIETDAEGHYIIYDSELDEYGYYDEEGAWWTLEGYVRHS